jgi:hypothetical protein
VGVWGKLVSYCARLALIVHLMRAAWGEVGDGGPLDAESLRRGIRLTDYFKAHLRVVYARIGLTAEDDVALRALKWVRSHGGRCTHRQLQRADVPGILKASVARKVLRDLADRGYGRLEEPQEGGKLSAVFVFDPS